MKVFANVQVAAVLDWVEQQLRLPTGAFDRQTARSVIGVDDDYELIVATVFDSWKRQSVEATIATDGTKRWATRQYISAVYQYAFETAGKNRLNMATAADNDSALRMHKALGHTQEGYHREWFGINKDAYSFGFTCSDWKASRWYRSNK
jgi:RimJ/RimL family protein N-acetyltransferase